MISLNDFVRAINDAIMQSHDSLMSNDVGILDKFFAAGESGKGEKEKKEKKEKKERGSGGLRPKNVIVEYQVLDAEGNPQAVDVHVPLITLVPLSISRIEKATLSADFDLEAIEGELQVSFSRHVEGDARGRSKLELTIAPQEASEGMKLLVEGYEAVLKRQIP